MWIVSYKWAKSPWRVLCVCDFQHHAEVVADGWYEKYGDEVVVRGANGSVVYDAAKKAEGVANVEQE